MKDIETCTDADDPPLSSVASDGYMDNYAALIQSLRDNPDQWDSDRYHLKHKPTGITLWVANGWSCLGADADSTVDVHLGLIGRWRLYREYRRWKKRQVQLKLGGQCSM